MNVASPKGFYAFACCVLIAACQTITSAPPTASGSARPEVIAPSLGLFSKIRAPADHEPVLTLGARGVQIFRCERHGNEMSWAFRQPEAELFDASGKTVGRHGASFSFEHGDGSRLLSTVVAYDEASNPNDLRWLLMTTRSFGKGVLDGITHVQRVNTVGGMPPPRCEAPQLGQLLRVDFKADFVFYRLRGGAAG